MKCPISWRKGVERSLWQQNRIKKHNDGLDIQQHKDFIELLLVNSSICQYPSNETDVKRTEE